MIHHLPPPSSYKTSPTGHLSHFTLPIGTIPPPTKTTLYLNPHNSCPARQIPSTPRQIRESNIFISLMSFLLTLMAGGAMIHIVIFIKLISMAGVEQDEREG